MLPTDDEGRVGQSLQMRKQARTVGFAAKKGAIDLVNVHDVEHINVLDVEEGLARTVSCTVSNGNDFRHLRHAYIHLFSTPVCRTSGHGPGTAPAWPGIVCGAAAADSQGGHS